MAGATHEEASAGAKMTGDARSQGEPVFFLSSSVFRFLSAGNLGLLRRSPFFPPRLVELQQKESWSESLEPC